MYVRVDHCTLWLAYFILFCLFSKCFFFFFCWCRWCCCLFFVGLLYWKYTKINERISSKKSNPNKYIYNKKKDHWPTITTTQNKKNPERLVTNTHTHSSSSSSSFIHNTVSDIWIDSIRLDSINKIRFRFGLFYWIQSTRENHLFLHCQYICPKTGGVFVCWNCQKKKSSIRIYSIIDWSIIKFNWLIVDWFIFLICMF